jgi:hypothetical protein
VTFRVGRLTFLYCFRPARKTTVAMSMRSPGTYTATELVRYSVNLLSSCKGRKCTRAQVFKKHRARCVGCSVQRHRIQLGKSVPTRSVGGVCVCARTRACAASVREFACVCVCNVWRGCAHPKGCREAIVSSKAVNICPQLGRHQCGDE